MPDGAEYAGSSAGASSSDEEEVEESQHWLVANLQHYGGDTPGIFLYIPFLMTLTTVWAVSHRLTTFFPLLDDPQELMQLQQTKFIEGIAVVIFGINLIVQSSGIFFEATPKKRILHSLVVFINLACCTTYAACALDVFPYFQTRGGLPTEFCRMFLWVNTTSIMILTIAALGGSANKNQLVPDWNLVLRTWMWDWTMFTSGAVYYYLGTTPVGNFFLMVVLFCLWRVFSNIGEMTAQSCKTAATSHEVGCLRGVEWLTYSLWSGFPVIHLLMRSGYIDHVEYELSIITIDIITKSVYSVVLLSSNLRVLDMFAIIREHQIHCENGVVQSSVVNVDALNKALQTAVVEAEAAARLSRKFLANMSHELRTPLNSVIAFSSQLVKAEDIAPLHKDYVTLSHQSAESLLAIINQVLEYAQLENDELDTQNAVAKGGSQANKKKEGFKQSLLPSLNLTTEPFSLTAVCDTLSETLLARASERRVDFAVIFEELWAPSGSKGWLLGDAKRVRQILVILCDNAIKFSRDDVTDRTANVRISMKTDAAKPDMENLSIKVTDNGCGIEKDKKDLLFKPFSQLVSHYARRHGGTGLALAICKKVVEAMHGTVTCSSEGSNKGSTFTVEMQLPRCAAPPGVVARDRTKLDGRVHLILSEGPTLDALGTACVRWGLEVKTNDSNRGRTLSASSKTRQPSKADPTGARVCANSSGGALENECATGENGAKRSSVWSASQGWWTASVLSLLEENLAEFQAGRSMRSVLILEGSIFMAIMETRPELKQVPNIIVICYQDWGEGVTSEVFGKVGLLLRPVKITSLRFKLEALLGAKAGQGCGKAGQDSDSPLDNRSDSPLIMRFGSMPLDSPTTDRSFSPLAARRGIRQQASASDVRSGSPGSPGLDRHFDHQAGGRVLLATDQAVAQRVAVAILRKTFGKNAVINLASDADEAFTKACEPAAHGAGLAYDVILMDVQMTNGLAAARKLRAWEADRADGLANRLVGMVAGTAESEEKECLAAGMDRHVRKPLNIGVVKQLMMDLGVLPMETLFPLRATTGP